MPKISDKDRENKRIHLLQTASDLFEENGYNKTSVNDIVRVANVSKGSFYTYYESKESLFFDIVHGADKEILNVEDRVSYDELENPLGNYINFRLRRFFNEENRIRAKYTYEFWTSTTLTLDQIKELKKRYTFFVSEITSLIELGQEKGFYRKDFKSETLIQLLIATIDGLIVLDTVLYRPIKEEHIEMAIDMFNSYLRQKRGHK